MGIDLCTSTSRISRWSDAISFMNVNDMVSNVAHGIKLYADDTYHFSQLWRMKMLPLER